MAVCLPSGSAGGSVWIDLQQAAAHSVSCIEIDTEWTWVGSLVTSLLGDTDATGCLAKEEAIENFPVSDFARRRSLYSRRCG